MTGTSVAGVQVEIGGGAGVAALLERPADPWALFLLAHGAGAGMGHPFLGAVSAALAGRGIATLRYQFPYMEARLSRPDPPAILTATVRAAAATAAVLLPGVPVIAGGKSLGGRMTSTAEATLHLPGVEGLAFLGFPLHPAARPGIARAEHLGRVRLPMLFLQGTRDALADLALLRGVLEPLQNARLHVVDGADHSFHVLKRSGRTDPEVAAELVATLVQWSAHLLGATS